ncbi:hypothetical protein LTR95_002568 [Oleoguttula sp. CCFEE 5521]
MFPSFVAQGSLSEPGELVREGLGGVARWFKTFFIVDTGAKQYELAAQEAPAVIRTTFTRETMADALKTMSSHGHGMSFEVNLKCPVASICLKAMHGAHDESEERRVLISSGFPANDADMIVDRRKAAITANDDAHFRFSFWVWIVDGQRLFAPRRRTKNL